MNWLARWWRAWTEACAERAHRMRAAHPCSEAWDEECRLLLDIGTVLEPIPGRRCVALFGPYTVWVSDHPYASMCPYGDGAPSVMPSRRTAERMYESLVTDDPVVGWMERQRAPNRADPLEWLR